MRDDTALTRVQDDEVAGFVGCVHNNGNTREQVRQRIFCRETKCEADDAGRRNPGGNIDVPGEEKEVDRQRKEDDFGNVLNELWQRFE